MVEKPGTSEEMMTMLREKIARLSRDNDLLTIDLERYKEMRDDKIAEIKRLREFSAIALESINEMADVLASDQDHDVGMLSRAEYAKRCLRGKTP